MPNRREFLAAAGVAAGAIWSRRAGAAPLGMPIGIQPYTVRNEMQKDLEGTLKKLVAMGYGAIETGIPFYGKTAAEERDLLKSVGLVSPSGFYWSPKEKADWDRNIEHAKTVGITYMITVAPEGWTKTLDGWRRTADRFNELGAVCKKAGTVLAYHNHNFEFRKFDGVTGYDELLRLTDPELVKMEMDCFWTTMAGRDPVTYLEKHPGRFALLHVKDMKKGYEPTTESPKGNPFTEVGTGIINYVPIFKAAPKGGVKQYYVEQDNWDRPALESARMSCEYLKKLSV
jgi:sugar phosphate isomerase/epimerase